MTGQPEGSAGIGAASAGANGLKRRDPVLDFWRGLALCVLCVDHVEEMAGVQALSYLTYAPVGVSTGAALFVFVSGTALGYAFLPFYERAGYFRLHARCLLRGWQLYLFNAFGLVATVALVTLLGSLLGPGSPQASIALSNGIVARFAVFRWNASYFDILPLYIIMLAMVPPLFAAFVRAPALGLGVSASLWLGTQWLHLHGMGAPTAFGLALYYNPLAWQFLFALGLLTGIRKRQGLSWPRLEGKWLYAAIACLVILGLWYKGARINVMLGLVGHPTFVHGRGVSYDVPWIDKSTLGPLRILHFLLLARVVTQFWPGRRGRSSTASLEPLATCGRHGLDLFVFTTIASYAAGAAVPALGGGRPLVLAADVTALAAMIGLAYVLEWKKDLPLAARKAQTAGAAAAAEVAAPGPHGALPPPESVPVPVEAVDPAHQPRPPRLARN
jgi:hypothetical protein